MQLEYQGFLVCFFAQTKQIPSVVWNEEDLGTGEKYKTGNSQISKIWDQEEKIWWLFDIFKNILK